MKDLAETVVKDIPGEIATPSVLLKRLTSEQVKGMFEQFDLNSDGELSEEELGHACRQLGLPFSAKESEQIGHQLMQAADENDDKSLSLSEFETYVYRKESDLQKVFSTLDVDGNGEIDKAEMRCVLDTLNCKVQEDDLERMLNVVDENGDGKITYDEFRDFFLITPYSSVKEIFEGWQQSTYYETGDAVFMPEVTGDNRPKWWNYLLAGGVAGAVSRTATAPLDRMKTLIQVQQGSVAKGKIANAIATMRAENVGLRAFWKGNGLNVVKIAPESAIKFAMYESLKSWICQDKNEPRPSERCIAGAAAGMVSSSVIYPLDIAKARYMTAQTGTYTHVGQVFTHAICTDGVKSLFRGLGVSLIGAAPYAGMDLMMYETLKGVVADKGTVPGPMVMLACGTVSSTIAATFTYPFAVVRTRLQVQGTAGHPILYNGIRDAFTTIVRTEGPTALYRGLAPNLMKVIPAVSLSYLTYEQMKIRLGL